MEPVFVALMVLVLLAGAGLCGWALFRLATTAGTAGAAAATVDPTGDR